MPLLTLAIDTSADVCAVALLADGRVLAEDGKAARRGHGEVLVPMAVGLVKGAGREIADLDVVGVAAGPGSFTGVRAGMAAAQGFALASNARAVGVSCLEAVAYGALASARVRKSVMCLLDTRRDSYFVQEYDAERTPLSAPAVLGGEAVARRLEEAEFVLAGNAVPRLLEDGAFPGTGNVEVASAADLPRVADLGRLAADGRSAGPPGDPVPLYVQPPHTTGVPRTR